MVAVGWAGEVEVLMGCADGVGRVAVGDRVGVIVAVGKGGVDVAVGRGVSIRYTTCSPSKLTTFGLSNCARY